MEKSDIRLLSPGDVALLAGVSSKTVTRWGDEGLLGDEERTAGGQRRYRSDAVAEFITRRDAAASHEHASHEHAS